MILLFNKRMRCHSFMGVKQVMTGLLLSCIAALLCLPVTVHALGFGTLELNSHLNEKLKAKVPVLLSGSEDMGQINIELASKAEYRRMGLPWNNGMAQIKVELENRHSASPVIALSSTGVIKLPILSIVLKANKEGRGTYFRHYQLLLDPADTAMIDDRLPIVPSVRLQTRKADVQTADGTSTDDSAWARIGRYGPVRTGDNLSEIAYRLRKDKRFLNNQVMLALYEQNPDSFVEGNINRLKKGGWLKVPSGDVVKKYGTSAALARVTELLQQGKTVARPKARKQAEEETVSADTATQELRYSGLIQLTGATGDQLNKHILDVVRKESGEKLESIHAELMSGKLQMDSLGDTVAALSQSMDGMQADVKSIKEDVKILKLQAQTPQESSGKTWMIAFFVLLAAATGLILGMFLRKSKQDAPDKKVPETKESRFVEPSTPVEAEIAVPPPPPASTRALDAVDSKINKIEESLGQCKYEEAEEMLDKAAELAPNSLRIAVLRAQLYHETGRHEERNDLINSLSESSDKTRWQEFCRLLPTHVWKACFGDADAEGGKP